MEGYKDSSDIPFNLPFTLTAVSTIQRLFYVTSMVMGIFLFGVVFRKGCRNSFIFVTILLCGFSLRSACSLQMYDVRIAEPTDTTSPEVNFCLDLHSPSMIHNGLTLLTLCVIAIRLNIQDTRRKLILQSTFIILMLVSTSGLALAYSAIPQNLKHTAVLKTENLLYYLTICEQDTKDIFAIFLIESLVIYLPTYLIMLILRRIKGKKDPMGRRIHLIKPCYRHSTEVCKYCMHIEASYFEVLYLYAVAFLLCRPAMFMYGLLTDNSITDIFPPVIGIVQYIYLSFSSFYAFGFKKMERNISYKAEECHNIEKINKKITPENV